MSPFGRLIRSIRRSRALVRVMVVLAGLLAVIAALRAGRSVLRAREEPALLASALAADWRNVPLEIVTRMSVDEQGGRAIIFLHGYSGNGPRYADFARKLVRARTRVFLPSSPIPFPDPDPQRAGWRAWWLFVDADMPQQYWGDEAWALAARRSRQLANARSYVLRLVAEIRARYAPDSVVIAGHSQGAMLALDAALAADPPVDKVAAFAGMLLADSVANVAKPVAKRPAVFLTHGRTDRLVPFEGAEHARKVLVRRGFDVRWEPRPGGHPLEQLESYAAFEFPCD